MLNKVNILGVAVSCVTSSTVLKEIEQGIKQKTPYFIVTPNPEHIIQAQSISEFKKVINSADLAVPDGIGVVWAVRRSLARALDPQAVKIERVTGVDLMVKLCEMAAQKKWIVGLMGGWGNTAKKTAQELERQFPELHIKVVTAPQTVEPDKPESNAGIAKEIKSAAIDVLFVAFGAPQQELWIAHHIKVLPDLKIVMGVGGAFDFLSGKVHRAPIVWQKLGFEWLFRLITEPWRWKRQLRLVVFAWKVLRS